MLGFSIPKILLLILIILIVWYGFKIFEKRTAMKKSRTSDIGSEDKSSKYRDEDIQDLEKCPKCNNYFIPGSKCNECNLTQ